MFLFQSHYVGGPKLFSKRDRNRITTERKDDGIIFANANGSHGVRDFIGLLLVSRSGLMLCTPEARLARNIPKAEQRLARSATGSAAKNSDSLEPRSKNRSSTLLLEITNSQFRKALESSQSVTCCCDRVPCKKKRSRRVSINFMNSALCWCASKELSCSDLNKMSSSSVTLRRQSSESHQTGAGLHEGSF